MDAANKHNTAKHIKGGNKNEKLAGDLDSIKIDHQIRRPGHEGQVDDPVERRIAHGQRGPALRAIKPVRITEADAS